MEFLNFPTVALGASLVCLIGMTIYAIMQRSSLRSRDEQLVVARAQAYAMLELSQAGVLFLDREHKLMGEASAAAPELLGHTCATGTAFVQVIADLVDVKIRRETVEYLEKLWQAEPSSMVDATLNPLARVHSGSRHLALRFARLVVDGRVHHIIVSIERISAPRIVPQTIEVPVLNEDTFAKRLAGETGTRPALTAENLATGAEGLADTGTAEQPTAAPVEIPAYLASQPSAEPATPEMSAPPVPVTVLEAVARAAADEALGPLDVTEDSVPSLPKLQTPVAAPPVAASGPATLGASDALDNPQLATTITSPETARAASQPAPASGPDPSSIADPHDARLSANVDPHDARLSASVDPHDVRLSAIVDPHDARLSSVLKEIMNVEAGMLETFLADARDKAGQLRAILKLPAREPQAFREKLVLILEMIRGINARARRLPLRSVCERADKFEEALGKLRDKQTLSGNDFLPIAVKLDDLLSHLAIQGEVVARLREWRIQNGLSGPPATDVTQRSATLTGTTIRQPRIKPPAAETETQKAKRLSDLSQASLEEMAQFLADMYSKRVSLVCVGLDDVPSSYRRTVEKVLGQLIHNAIRHGVEMPADRAVQQKPETGTVGVQFVRTDSGYQLTVQDDGRGLDHEKIRAEAIRQGVLTADDAAKLDARKLAGLIFRPGFTTVGEGGARGIGMDVVRDLVNKAGGRVGIATKPGEYTRFRISLPPAASSSAVA